MRTSLLRLSPLFAALVALACAPATSTVDTAADEQAINAVREREIAAFSAGSTDSLAAVYTSDVVSMPPNEPMLSGVDAVRTWAQNINNLFTVNGRYTSADIDVAGDWAIERFTGELTLTPKAGGPAVTEQLKGIHVYQRQADGTWLITQDVWNVNAPPPAPPPAK
jgi:ketosteroid isomerase-like protein